MGSYIEPYLGNTQALEKVLWKKGHGIVNEVLSFGCLLPVGFAETLPAEDCQLLGFYVSILRTVHLLTLQGPSKRILKSRTVLLLTLQEPFK